MKFNDSLVELTKFVIGDTIDLTRPLIREYIYCVTAQTGDLRSRASK